MNEDGQMLLCQVDAVVREHTLDGLSVVVVDYLAFEKYLDRALAGHVARGAGVAQLAVHALSPIDHQQDVFPLIFAGLSF